MKILIVNGFSNNYNGNKHFEDFVAIIKEIFVRQKQSLIDLPDVVIRDRSNLDDYLYEPNSQWTNKEAEKIFDYLDFVFIDGEGNMLPWQKKCEKLSILFKMCKKTNKCLFAAGCGMQMLIYYCATFYQDLKVINGNEKGGPLSAIQDVPARILPTLEKNQCFLDNLTGDFYHYDHQINEWKPYGNVGLHYSRAMASLGGIVGGDLIKKVTTYQSKVNNLKPVLFYSKLTDVKCNIKKQYISHALMQECPQEFVVENRNMWDPHPVNITNINAIETNYDTLAESERGPQIVQHQNTVAVQFHIDKKYKETVQVAYNFVKIKLASIQNYGKVGLTLEQAYLKMRQLQFNPRKLAAAYASNQSQNQITQRDNDYSDAGEVNLGAMKSLTSKSTKNNRPMTAQQMTFTKEFKHSGLGYSKRRGAVIVDNNAVSQSSIPAATSRDQAKKWVNRSTIKIKQEAASSYFGEEHVVGSTTQGGYKSEGLFSQRGLSGYSVSRNQQSQKNLQSERVPLTFNSSKLVNVSQPMTRQPSSKGAFGINYTGRASKVTFQDQVQRSQPDHQEHQNDSLLNSRNQINQISLSNAYSNSQVSTAQQKPRSTLRHLRNYQIEKDFKEQLQKDAEQLWKNQKEIRQMLHPTLCEEFLPEDRDMNTKSGLLSASRSQQTLLIMKENRNVIDQTPSRSVFCRYKDFKKMPQYNPEIPVIRNASPYVGPEEEQLRLKDIENKKTWISKQNFRASFGKATTNNDKNFIKNYVTATPSDPPMLHQFREEKKDGWLKGPFKV